MTLLRAALYKPYIHSLRYPILLLTLNTFAFCYGSSLLWTTTTRDALRMVRFAARWNFAATPCGLRILRRARTAVCVNGRRRRLAARHLCLVVVTMPRTRVHPHILPNAHLTHAHARAHALRDAYARLPQPTQLLLLTRGCIPPFAAVPGIFFLLISAAHMHMVLHTYHTGSTAPHFCIFRACLTVGVVYFCAAFYVSSLPRLLPGSVGHAFPVYRLHAACNTFVLLSFCVPPSCNYPLIYIIQTPFPPISSPVYTCQFFTRFLAWLRAWRGVSVKFCLPALWLILYLLLHFCGCQLLYHAKTSLTVGSSL